MAALITESLHVQTDVEPGGRGEFSVWVDGTKVAEKSRTGFPGEKAVLESVAQALRARPA